MTMPANNSEIRNRLWDAADEPRANSRRRGSEYFGCVSGLIFLWCCSEKFPAPEKALRPNSAGSHPPAMVRMAACHAL